ncbi:MAG: hypothetical protein ABI780_02380 [Ardenticatenales bacterium]
MTPVQDRLPRAPADEGAAIGFHALGRQLLDPEPEVRRSAALLAAAFRPADAAPALVRAYAQYGDEVLLDAARAFGHHLTAVVAREVLDHSRGTLHHARLLELLGATGDPFAAHTLREASHDLDATVRIAAQVALLALEDRDAADGVESALLSPRPAHRVQALQLLRRLDNPAARALERAHMERFVADGGAIPADITVALPLLLDAEGDLIDYLVRATDAASESLVLLAGPASGPLADRHRDDLARRLGGRTLFFSTDRHSVAEQADILALACAAAGRVAPRGEKVVLVGPVPDPADALPGMDLLSAPGRARFEARLVFAGPTHAAPVLRWWSYLAAASPVPGRIHTVLTDLVLGAERLGPEALAVYAAWCARDGGERDDALARALLARLGSDQY